jgi:hypothetical protein
LATTRNRKSFSRAASWAPTPGGGRSLSSTGSGALGVGSRRRRLGLTEVAATWPIALPALPNHGLALRGGPTRVCRFRRRLLRGLHRARILGKNAVLGSRRRPQARHQLFRQALDPAHFLDEGVGVVDQGRRDGGQRRAGRGEVVAVLPGLLAQEGARRFVLMAAKKTQSRRLLVVRTILGCKEQIYERPGTRG